MNTTGRLDRVDTRWSAWTALRAHVMVFGLVLVVSAGLLDVGVLVAPLGSVLLIGILLLCPLLMWVPFRFEQRARDRLTSRGRNRQR